MCCQDRTICAHTDECCDDRYCHTKPNASSSADSYCGCNGTTCCKIGKECCDGVCRDSCDDSCGDGYYTCQLSDDMSVCCPDGAPCCPGNLLDDCSESDGVCCKIGTIQCRPALLPRQARYATFDEVMMSNTPLAARKIQHSFRVWEPAVLLGRTVIQVG